MSAMDVSARTEQGWHLAIDFYNNRHEKSKATALGGTIVLATLRDDGSFPSTKSLRVAFPDASLLVSDGPPVLEVVKNETPPGNRVAFRFTVRVKSRHDSSSSRS
jgi:hypothetical protein